MASRIRPNGSDRSKDGRSVIVTLTLAGIRKLREAQVTHHACVRELLFAGMRGDDLKLIVRNPGAGRPREFVGRRDGMLFLLKRQ